MNKGLFFSTSTEMLRLPVEAVVFIKADGNYSAITTADGSKYVLTVQLGQIEQRIGQIVAQGDNRFVRLGRSIIINRDYITSINPSHQRLVLSDCRTFRHDVTASREALKLLKEYIEKEMEQ